MKFVDINIETKKIYCLLTSFSFACFANIQCINRILSAYMSRDNEEGGMLSLLYLIILAVILITTILSRQFSFRSIDKASLFIMAFTYIFYVTSSVYIGEPAVPFLQFVVFTLSALIVPSIARIDTKIFLKSVMLTSALGISVANRIFIFVADWHEYISMGVTYSFMLPIVATVIYFSLYFKDENKAWKVIMLVLGGINFYYFFLMFTMGSRGPSVVIMSTLIMLYCINLKETGGINLRKKQTAFLLISFILALFFFLPLLQFLHNIFLSMGISSNVIDKFLRLALANDATNGRDYVYEFAIDGILNSPIWGNGFDRFEANTGMAYPHNSILQLLYDGGVILFGLVLIPFFKKLTRISNYCLKNEYALIMTFFCSGFVGSMFSGDLWKTPLFWALIGIVLSFKKCEI